MTNCPHCPAHLDRVTTQSGPALHCPSCGHVEAIRNKPQAVIAKRSKQAMDSPGGGGILISTAFTEAAP